jgi:hypothetical protein
MFTLFNHTFHTLQPLDVSCFKPFKTMLKKRGGWGNGKEQVSRNQQDHASRLGVQGRVKAH